MRLGAPDSPAEVQMKTVGRCAAAPKRAGAVQMQDRHCCSSTSPHAELNDQGEVAAVVLAALDLGWWRELAATVARPNGSALILLRPRSRHFGEA